MLLRSVLWTLIGLSISSISAQAGIRVVSDIDDTTKITNVGDPLASAWNALFTTRAFTGMSELYSTFSIRRGYAFDYLSGSPEILTGNVKEFLERNGFPKGGMHLRPLFGSGTVREYKTRQLKRIMELHPLDQFILIGDDTQNDSVVYDDVFRMAPDRILSIYIRKVANGPLPPSEYPFLSAFDIARTEYLMGRMEVEEAAATASSIIEEPRDRRIMPRFTYCPDAPIPIHMDPEMERWTGVIYERVEKICKARHLFRDEN